MRRIGISASVLPIFAISVATGCAAPQVSASPAARATVEATASATRGTTTLEKHDMSVINGTALAVTMFVNGTMVETVPAQSDRTFAPAALPERPWDLQFTTAAGRVLLDYHVEPGWPIDTVQPDGSTMITGWGKYADLSCGRLLVLSGLPLPLPHPGPGSPGDCVA